MATLVFCLCLILGLLNAVLFLAIGRELGCERRPKKDPAPWLATTGHRDLDGQTVVEMPEAALEWAARLSIEDGRV
jgi:hypothetical protein